MLLWVGGHWSEISFVMIGESRILGQTLANMLSINVEVKMVTLVSCRRLQ